ncbi:hypothetical protein H6P81_021596 [Aristolochia fimbriata]|uniref:Uncharacterized protein n=1 Tax=Aristolochia fimbriata TaxID=158543 RepID=A0AAV7DPG4_ARIFI|nr:hypothetical protein H6P81_021596 [Aristolochia fimbriata]
MKEPPLHKNEEQTATEVQAGQGSPSQNDPPHISIDSEMKKDDRPSEEKPDFVVPPSNVEAQKDSANTLAESTKESSQEAPVEDQPLATSSPRTVSGDGAEAKKAATDISASSPTSASCPVTQEQKPGDETVPSKGGDVQPSKPSPLTPKAVLSRYLNSSPPAAEPSRRSITEVMATIDSELEACSSSVSAPPSDRLSFIRASLKQSLPDLMRGECSAEVLSWVEELKGFRNLPFADHIWVTRALGIPECAKKRKSPGDDGIQAASDRLKVVREELASLQREYDVDLDKMKSIKSQFADEVDERTRKGGIPVLQKREIFVDALKTSSEAFEVLKRHGFDIEGSSITQSNARLQIDKLCDEAEELVRQLQAKKREVRERGVVARLVEAGS